MTKYFTHETAVIDPGAQIGEGTKIWHFCHIMSSALIGKNCILGQNVMVADGVIIGNGVKIQNNVSIYKGVKIEEDVFVGPSVVFTNVKVPRSFIERKTEFLDTYIEKGASIGANSTIVCGVSIGQYAMIGAGAVVTKNVKPHALMMGNPAKQKGWVSRTGCVLDFKTNEIAICAESGEKYQVINHQLINLK
ncbi:DapH/DapD/GlmU-related protein [Nubsella zeaxanthinifaciens]|uniref:acyltransferase n=1 Tax=Nubsella zeaxanthinifaciens TaxID=392412 RepID=UPI003CFEF8B3